MAIPTTRMTVAKTSRLMTPSPPAKRRRLLPFDRAGWLGRDVVDDAVHALDLVDDAGRDAGEHLVGKAGPIGGHRVLAHHRAERHDLGVGAKVAHYADCPHRHQDGECLPHGPAESGGLNLLLDNGV